MSEPQIFSQIVMLSPEVLHPNDWNPNEMDPKKFEILVKEIKDRGWVGNPLIVREDPKKSETPYEIIDGEHRWKAGKLAGLKQEPCIILEVPETSEAWFKTYVLNNLRGEINEVKLAVLIKNMKDKGISTNLIYNRTGIRGHKQRALIELLTPKDMSKKAVAGAKGQHRSFAVILSLEENEIVHRAIKLTRLHNDVDCLMAIVDFYLDKHSLTIDQHAKIKTLLDDVEGLGDSQGLATLCTYYLENVTKEEIRKDE